MVSGEDHGHAHAACCVRGRMSVTHIHRERVLLRSTPASMVSGGTANLQDRCFVLYVARLVTRDAAFLRPVQDEACRCRSLDNCPD